MDSKNDVISQICEHLVDFSRNVDVLLGQSFTVEEQQPFGDEQSALLDIAEQPWDIKNPLLHEELQKRSLNVGIERSLLSLYNRKCDDWKVLCQKQWSQLQSDLEASESDESYSSLMKNCFAFQVRSHLFTLRASILKKVDERIKVFEGEVHAIAQSDSDLMSEEDTCKMRGHSRLAISILERTFLRTTNITKAEKLKLAQATKLEPRQVTIWVSAELMRPLPSLF